MTTARAAVLLVLLAAGLAPRASAVGGKVLRGLHDVTHITKEVVRGTVEKIPVVGSVVSGARVLTKGVANTALDVAEHVGEKIDDTIQAGADAVAPATPCYEPLGCFPMTGPWWSIDRLVPAPQKPEEIDTRFYLYTRAKPARYYIQTRPNVSVDKSDYDGSRTTVIITHGFASSGNSSWLEKMKDALLNKIDANVILVDWGKGSSKLNYFQVAANTRVVGAEIARVCLYLMKNHGMSPMRLHLVGHSLGAHIMSYVSRNVTKIARITGLDPAQPLFENFPEAVLLDRSDAAFVDIVHTDAEPFFPFLGFGIIKPYGDDDFYINGGKNQPGCRLTDLVKPNITGIAQLATTLVETISDYVKCPHGRSYEVWTASLLHNCTFLGARYPQSSEESMSEEKTNKERRGILDYVAPLGLATIQFPARGSFNVKTTDAEPFCDESSTDMEVLYHAAKQLKGQ